MGVSLSTSEEVSITWYYPMATSTTGRFTNTESLLCPVAVRYPVDAPTSRVATSPSLHAPHLPANI